ncbi:hypothetical protein P43SY_001527 [Pythium insidiosum]|uniref:U6 snRNA-associated Sm-like protein LSm4 n=1 Tax=Pythium insidiosum TaxID=114742 RepID=A0AAD5LZZ3_PYTIN|nr:hypothetical protein P43SY_001527 [Pythium insidiosum]
MLVELKNGDTYNGNLVNCDTWMNINLREVICTSKDGDRFWKMPECYIRGNAIKYIRVPNEIVKLTVVAVVVVDLELERGVAEVAEGQSTAPEVGVATAAAVVTAELQEELVAVVEVDAAAVASRQDGLQSDSYLFV